MKKMRNTIVTTMLFIVLYFVCVIIPVWCVTQSIKKNDVNTEYAEFIPDDYEMYKELASNLNEENDELKVKLGELHTTCEMNSIIINNYIDEVNMLEDMLIRQSLDHELRISDSILIKTNVNWVFEEMHTIKDVNDYRNDFALFINEKSQYATQLDECHYYYDKDTLDIFICWYKIGNTYIEFDMPMYDRTKEEMIVIFYNLTDSLEIEVG